MQDIRLKKVFDVASRLFIIQGFSGTQIGQIAREAGISIGSMYDLFTSKRVILDFLVRCIIEPGFIDDPHKLPLDASLFEGLETQVAEAFETILSQFEEPLQRDCQQYSYAQMLSEAFDVLSKYGTGCMLVESNPETFGSLFALYARYRKRFYHAVEQYVIVFRARGQLREQPTAEHAARYILGSLFWWTMQIHYDIFEGDEPISPAAAKQICTDALLYAYAANETRKEVDDDC